MKNKNTNLLRVVKYIRVSTDRQAKTGDSLREQDETLSAYIDKAENMLLVDTYIDDGVSGQKLKRNDFIRLMDAVKRDHIDIILFTKIDRWFRNQRHYLNTQAILEKHGVTWTAVSQPFFDTTSAHGRAFVSQSMTWAELEAQNDSERILAVNENKVKNGEVLSGTAPLGYDIVDKHLVPNEEAAKVVKIYEFYQKTPNLRALMRYAGEEFGIIRVHSSFKRLMQNTKYKGVFRNNNNYCPPIVTLELWEECNRLLGRNQRANKVYDYAFSGMIVCNDCGYKMAGCTQKKRQGKKFLDPKTGKDGRVMFRYPSYRCQRRLNTSGCINTKQYFESTIEKSLLARLKNDIKDHIATYEVSIAPVITNDNKRRAILTKHDRLKELYLNELITLNEFKKDRAALDEKLDELDREKLPVVKKDLSDLYALLETDIESIYYTMDANEKNRFWRSFINEIRIDNDHNMEIIFL